eukprot:XP_025015273.1 uncharacterized protein LOC112536688 [Ricinus communis]
MGGKSHPINLSSRIGLHGLSCPSHSRALSTSYKCQERGHIASECPKRNTLTIHPSEEDSYGYESESNDEDVEEYDAEENDNPLCGVVKRVLHSEPLKDMQQRENLFHTRCKVLDKTCDVIVDGGLCNGYGIHRTLIYRKGLPPFRGNEHAIDLIPGAPLPNKAAYRCNPEQAKELQRQVEELIEKGYVRESLSSCAVPALLMPKKEGTWRMCINSRAINNITIKC